MKTHKNRDEERKQNKNIIQVKFNSINPIHQTNANRIIIITTNDVQCETSVKCIRESSIESISKLFEIANQVEKSSKQFVIKFRYYEMNPQPNTFSILSIIIVMKIKNRIEDKDEHSQRLEILNQNTNSTLLGVDPSID